MMTCKACCREFKSGMRGRNCPYCGFNNGRGWWPRTDDVPGRLAAEQREKQLEKEHRARRRAKRQRLRRQEGLAHG